MNYYITTSGKEILELFRDDYIVIPPAAISINEEDGEMLRQCSNFSDYQYIDQVVIRVGDAKAVALAQAIVDANSRATAKADATIQYLVNHTPTEIEAKVRQLVGASGVTNLATAVTSLKAVEDLLVHIGIALSVAAKDKLR